MRLLVLLLLVPLTGFAAWQLETSDVLSDADGVTCRALVFRDETATLKAHWVKWDRRHTLRVVDLAPDESVAEGARRANAKAAVNGGYFHPDRTPLGLVISGGETLHRWENSKLLTGVLSVSKTGKIQIRRKSDAITIKADDQDWSDALQAGPFLVDNGKCVLGLNATKAAERTVVVADKNGVIALLVTGPITLAQLGKLLAKPGLWPEKIERALNLDGGSSTALWLASGTSLRTEWKRVRNAVVISEK